MSITKRKFEVKLWREDLAGFYRYFLKTIVLDLDRFERDLVFFEKSDQIAIRKFRTATLIGIALVRDQIFDDRWMLGKLLGLSFTDREHINCFLDAILSTPEAREHVRRAKEYLNSNPDWKNSAVQSVEGQKSIRVAMMRSAVRIHNVSKSFTPYYWNEYYWKDIKVIW